MGSAVCILPYFIFTLFKIHNKATRPLGRLAVFAMFVLTVKWLSLVPFARNVEGGGLWICLIYVGNMIETGFLAGILAWNMNQYLKYESDYGIIPKVPTSSEITQTR
jgi:hypothetical protein